MDTSIRLWAVSYFLITTKGAGTAIIAAGSADEVKRILLSSSKYNGVSQDIRISVIEELNGSCYVPQVPALLYENSYFEVW